MQEKAGPAFCLGICGYLENAWVLGKHYEVKARLYPARPPASALAFEREILSFYPSAPLQLPSKLHQEISAAWDHLGTRVAGHLGSQVTAFAYSQH